METRQCLELVDGSEGTIFSVCPGWHFVDVHEIGNDVARQGILWASVSGQLLQDPNRQEWSAIDPKGDGVDRIIT